MEEAGRGKPRSRAAAAVTAVVVALVAASTRLGPLQNPDILWQVRSGELVIARGTRLTTDAFSALFRGQPVFDHETGFEVLAAFLHAHGGMMTLWVANLVIVALAAAVAVHAVRDWVPSEASRVVGASIALSVVATRLELRAESVTFAAIAIAHALRRGGEGLLHRLSPILVLACAAPFHGLAIVIAAVPIASAAEALLARRVRDAALDVGVAALSVLAGELTAPGMIGYVRASRGATAAYEHVVEGYSPLRYVIGFGDPMPFIALAVAVVACASLVHMAREGRRARPSDAILIALLVIPGCRYVRFSPMAVLATLPWSIAGLARLVEPLRRRVRSTLIAGMLSVVAAALALTMATASLGFEGIGGFAFGHQPTESVAWLQARRPDATVFHPYNFGAYLIYARYPKSGVVIDPRGPMLYPDAFIRSYYDAVANPARFEAWNVEHPFDTVLLARRHRGTATLREYLERSPRWTVAHEDVVGVVFVRR